MRFVHPRAQPRRHQRRGVALLDDRGAVECHSGCELVAGVAGSVDEAAAAEVDWPTASPPPPPPPPPAGGGGGGGERDSEEVAAAARLGSAPMAVTRSVTSSIGAFGKSYV